MSLIEKRYAEALISVAERMDEVNLFRQDLQAAVKVFAESRDLRLLLLNPFVSCEVKKDISARSLTGSVRQEILNLFLLLVDKRRIVFLPGILNEYIKLADRKMKVLNLRISSPAALAEEQLNRLQEKFRGIYGAASVKAELIIDAKLIGGVRVQAGGRLADGTVRGKLDNMREALIKG